MDDFDLVDEIGERRNYGSIPLVLLILAIAIILDLIPVIDLFGFVLGAISVIAMFMDGRRLKASERTSFHVSVVVYLIGLAALVAGILYSAFFYAFSSGSEAASYAFAQHLSEAYILATVLLQLAFMFFPLGLAGRAEKKGLYAAFIVYAALGLAAVLLVNAGFITVHRVSSSTMSFSIFHIVSWLAVPGVAMMCGVYLFISLRLYRESGTLRRH